MPSAADVVARVFKIGTGTFLARILGWDGSAITQADISAAEYSIYELDPDDPDLRTAVDGHEGVSLEVASVIFNDLQTDLVWTVDETGYNFRHTIDISTDAAFPKAETPYLVEYKLTPTSGQVILVRFKLRSL